MYDKAVAWGDTDTWSIDQYDSAYNVLKDAEKNLQVNKKGGTSNRSVPYFGELSDLVQRYEKNEGRRRAAIRKAHKDNMKVRWGNALVTLCRMKESFQQYLQGREWTESQHHEALNGPILPLWALSPDSLYIAGLSSYHVIPNSIFEEADTKTQAKVLIKLIADHVEDSGSVTKQLNEDDYDSMEYHLPPLEQHVAELSQLMEPFEALCNKEVARRRGLEQATVEQQAIRVIKRHICLSKFDLVVVNAKIAAKREFASKIKAYEERRKASVVEIKRRDELRKVMMNQLEVSHEQVESTEVHGHSIGMIGSDGSCISGRANNSLLEDPTMVENPKKPVPTITKMDDLLEVNTERAGPTTATSQGRAHQVHLEQGGGNMKQNNSQSSAQQPRFCARRASMEADALSLPRLVDLDLGIAEDGLFGR
jgi:hypothetical protein